MGAVVCLLASCSPLAETDNKPMKSGIILNNMDTTVNPGNNFIEYVNGSWNERTEIPDDKGLVASFIDLNDRAEENVRAIIEEVAEKDVEQGSNEQKIGDLYISYTDTTTRNQLGIAPLEPELKQVNSISSYTDLAEYFGYAEKYGFGSPFGISVLADFKNPDYNVAYTRQSGLGLPEREYYLKQDSASVALRNRYQQHIRDMFDRMELPGGNKAAETILALETRIAEKHLTKEKSRDLKGNYNMYPLDSFKRLMPRFNWNVYFRASEIAAINPEQFGTLSKEYMVALDTIIATTPLEDWKTYLAWGVIRNSAGRLSTTISNKNWEFFGNELYGNPQRKELWRRGVAITKSVLGEAVGEVYVEKHFPPEAKAKMNELVNNLLKAYEISIKELTWMTDSTKAEALDKLAKFTTKIGYPDEWKTYDYEITPDDYFGNRMRGQLYEHRRDIKDIGKPVDKKEWGLPPQTVNAYYNPTQNEIVFPAAILQPPFFNMEAEDAVNYGAIGAVIGHEIGHGFDDKGSAFDGDGKLRNWWTDKDREAFRQRTSQLVNQYNQFEVLPGVFVNGEFTLGENIGDLGGLSIAMKAYELSLNGKEAPVLDGFTGKQRVLIGYAQVWRNKIRDKRLRLQVNTDPHSPADVRVNGVVRNVPEFYTAFNVEPSDSLYLPPEKRVKIW